ncbi:substrate-binding domain-containing protein, partial [Streptomyces diastatochromogenes]|uniref:substrate-binding domain-containing protein n=1 Tax=Streptomyces diastatochromogenes TaxID=42236 RepID=UPI00368D521E
CVCVSDTGGLGARRGVAVAGGGVPGQVKVIGFDNVDESAFLVPSLSTVDPDHDLMAERAVALLVARMGHEGRPAHQEEFVSSFSLVIRESTGR